MQVGSNSYPKFENLGTFRSIAAVLGKGKLIWLRLMFVYTMLYLSRFRSIIRVIDNSPGFHYVARRG